MAPINDYKDNKKQIDHLKHKQKLLEDPATIHGFGQMSLMDMEFHRIMPRL